jgi:hypothetical protein
MFFIIDAYGVIPMPAPMRTTFSYLKTSSAHVPYGPSMLICLIAGILLLFVLEAIFW